ncbi:MAG: ABC transporter permease [Verrucomicrobiota bacterium]
MSEKLPPHQSRPWSEALAKPAARALIALAMVLIVGSIFNADHAFFKLGTHRDTLRQASVYGILACGLTLVIVSGGIDLAVGSVLALTAVCGATMAIHWGWSGWLVVPACLLIGGVSGGVSGWVTARLRVQPFIATLALMVLARGAAKYVSGGMKVSTAVRKEDGTYNYVDVPGLFRGIDTRNPRRQRFHGYGRFRALRGGGLVHSLPAGLGALPLRDRQQ